MEIDKIYLGDAYKLIKELPNNSVDCIYVDIPYVLPNSRGGSGGFMSKRINNMSNNQLNDISKGLEFRIFKDFIRVLKNMNLIIWCNKFLLNDLLTYFIPLADKYEIMFWGKTNPIPMTNNVWLSDVEYVLWFGSKKIKLNDGYNIKSKFYVSPINQADKNLFNHPTIKPIELVKRHLQHITQPNDVVLDCFCGSGTTCVAAKELGRHFIGMEIDPEYHKIAVDRLNGITANGQTSIFTDFKEVV